MISKQKKRNNTENSENNSKNFPQIRSRHWTCKNDSKNKLNVPARESNLGPFDVHLDALTTTPSRLVGRRRSMQCLLSEEIPSFKWEN